MPPSAASPELFPQVIVLLPPADSAAQALVRTGLHTVQLLLGTAIQVLRVPTARHPTLGELP